MKQLIAYSKTIQSFVIETTYSVSACHTLSAYALSRKLSCLFKHGLYFGS